MLIRLGFHVKLTPMANVVPNDQPPDLTLLQFRLRKQADDRTLAIPKKLKKAIA
ncbi:hypothetical protein [Nostoc sp. MG11]|uniref:hypothetical protein n=1 Tax=Nostoc sp. MG11 TaxID=2721166 RepID=UPI0018696C09|nr:hypothetical protein [Nostoc sp. MG11]